jgi:hypothetical protein
MGLELNRVREKTMDGLRERDDFVIEPKASELEAKT